MRPLARKLGRDLRHAGAQLAALALLVACGVASLVSMRAMEAHLAASQASYYRTARFGDVWVRVREAPRAARTALTRLPGVTAVETCVVGDAVGELRRPDGAPQVIALRLVGLPLPDHPAVNDLHLRRGRWPSAGTGEALVSEGFAKAHRLGPGDTLTAVLHGRWQRFTVVGIALSPEYIYEMPPGGMFPDPGRFAVVWVDDALLRAAWGLGEGWNDAVLRVADDRVPPGLLAGVDAIAAPYGGTGATTRADQPSHRFVSDEISQNRVGATIVPAIFLGIAAFLTHVVLGRLVEVQRDQAAVLKAFGYPDRVLARHYLAFALAPVLAGWVVGVLAGARLSVLFAQVYADYYRFPTIAYAPQPGPALAALAVTVAAGALGAVSSVYRTLRLAPAEAMRPDAPPGFHAGPIERRLLGVIPVRWRIPLRQLERRPWRAVVAVVGLGLAIGAIVVARYAGDALDLLDRLAFVQSQRQDLDVTFVEPAGDATLRALAERPGVFRVEGYRVTAARLGGPNGRRVVLLGIDPGGELHRVVSFDGHVAAIPPRGMLLSDKLARLLAARPGTPVHVAIVEGRRPEADLTVAGVVADPLGLTAYLDRRTLDGLLGEGPRASGAWLEVDPAATDTLLHTLVSLPAVAGVTVRAEARVAFRRTIATSMGIMMLVLVGFSVLIAFGLAYNGARVALSERARELASLRVLGFARRGVAVLFLAEQAVLLVLALPVGAALGAWMVAITVRSADTEMFRFPYVLRPVSILYGVGVVVLSAAVSAALVWRRLDRMDLVSVLKSRE
ncbi:MAG TPA: ABC transporter permease [Gemmatimonadales bacterium]|nr:ABC transporter permease [Gemmatimonadales bacterium]